MSQAQYWTREKQAEVVSWLATRTWTIAGHYTFEQELSVADAVKVFEKGYCRGIERATRQRLIYFGIVSKGGKYERVHIHALLATKPDALRQAHCAWKKGLSEVHNYYAGNEIYEYIVRHAPIPESEWICSLESLRPKSWRERKRARRRGPSRPPDGTERDGKSGKMRHNGGGDGS